MNPTIEDLIICLNSKETDELYFLIEKFKDFKNNENTKAKLQNILDVIEGLR